MSEYTDNDKMVSHPPHYQSASGLEVIDVIEAFTDGLEGIEAVAAANIIKYICRWKRKNGIQDIKKAIWYAERLISHLEDQQSEETTVPVTAYPGPPTACDKLHKALKSTLNF